jgi:hypothetical protein
MISQSMNVSCTRRLPISKEIPKSWPCKGFQYTARQNCRANLAAYRLTLGQNE